MWYNSIIKVLIRSPLHFLISKNILLITYKGRKSEKVYTIPVNYLREGDDLYITSWRDRVWWRNLCGGKPVIVHVEGDDKPALAEVIEDEAEAVNFLLNYFKLAPKLARYYDIEIDAGGNPEGADIRRLTQKIIAVRVQLVG
jgi:deazaflavin-dependent oxidoreductase (nitroreductase family)